MSEPNKNKNHDSNSNSNSHNNNFTTAVPSKKLKITTPTVTTTKHPMGATTTNTDAERKDEFEIVKEYLLKCPLVASVHDSPAIKAAIEGIEKEQKRRIRDAKLRSKFGGGVGGVTTTSASTSSRAPPKISGKEASGLNDGDEIVVVEKDDVDVDITVGTRASKSVDIDNNDDMEWQDVDVRQQQQQDEDAMVPSVSAIGDSFTMEQGDNESSSPSQLQSRLQSPSPLSPPEGCFLGRTLARACIETIAEQQQRRSVTVSSPLAAIAVALHASLRSNVLGFVCTGVQENANANNTKGNGKSLGFAPPVRELPKTEFLPPGWDTSKTNNNNNNNNDNNNIQALLRSPTPLRYRKKDTGAVVLTVEGHPSNDDRDIGTTTATGTGTSDGAMARSTDYDCQCRVTFVPANSKDDATHPCLRFLLSEHINLDSWTAAAAKQKQKTKTNRNNGTHKIAPSLHYKNLSGLLSKFCRTFDLGAVQNDSVGDGDEGFLQSSKKQPPGVFAEHHFRHATAKAEATRGSSTNPMESRDTGYSYSSSVPSTLDKAFPPHHPAAVTAAAAAARRAHELMLRECPPNRGDFADDLLPASSGLMDPRFGRVGGRIGGSGNLMGPGHPLFSRGGNGNSGGYYGGNVRYPGGYGPPIGGPGTMQPRYDPVMPPGIGGNDILPGIGPGHEPGSAPANRRPRNAPRNPGEPNPDHLFPPNSLGNNMFM